MAACRPFSVSHSGKLWATMERGTVRVRSTTMGNYGGIWAAMAAYRPFSVSHDGKQWATMERATFRSCLTTMGNYGDVWATLATYRPFFGFARRKAMGNNGARHFPSLLNDDGQLWRRLGNNEYYRTERRPNNHKIVRSFSCFRTFVFS